MRYSGVWIQLAAKNSNAVPASQSTSQFAIQANHPPASEYLHPDYADY